MNKDSIFAMKKSVLNVTQVCTLNCKLCAAFSPYRKNDHLPSVSELCEYIDRYMKIVDYCEIFTISGGEPLLHKNLSEVLEHLFVNYNENIGKVEIITNGTIIPGEKLLKTIKNHESKFWRFLIDDYGKNLSRKVNNVVAAINRYSLPYTVRDYNSDQAHCGGWVDYGSLESIIHDPKEATLLYEKCNDRKKFNFCYPIVEGKMMPCSPISRRVELGTALPSEYIDLMDDTLTIEQQRQKIKDIYSFPYLETCRYCNGLCDDSPRFAPAEQLTSEEILKIKKDCT